MWCWGKDKNFTVLCCFYFISYLSTVSFALFYVAPDIYHVYIAVTLMCIVNYHFLADIGQSFEMCDIHRIKKDFELKYKKIVAYT